MMLRCEIVRDILPLYLDGCCSEVTVKEVEEHLENCQECNRIAQEMKIEIEVSEDERLRNAAPKELLEEGKEMIEKKVKGDILGKVVYVDILVNIAFCIYNMSIMFGPLAYLEDRIRIEDNMSSVFEMVHFISMCSVPVLPCLVIGQIFYIINHNFRKKDTYTSRFIAMSSLYVKVAVAVPIIIIQVVFLLAK